jgi:heat shock protein HslJ
MVPPKKYPIVLCVVLMIAILLTACGGGAAPSSSGSTSAPTLAGPTWRWQKTEFNSGKTIPVASPDNYTLQFATDGTVSIKADCNTGSGNYVVANGTDLTINVGAMTRAACAPDSLSDEFITELGQVIHYTIDRNGELVLALNTGAGMRYKQ